jgi:hypothetical protein
MRDGDASDDSGEYFGTVWIFGRKGLEFEGINDGIFGKGGVVGFFEGILEGGIGHDDYAFGFDVGKKTWS